MINSKPSYLTLAATTLALGLGVAYTLAVGVAQGPSASSPESFAASTSPVDCILGEIIPTPVVGCDLMERVKKPILVEAQNGGAPCPDEYVDFQGEKCKCPDGSPINPNRTDCADQQKDLKDGCCVDRPLCPDGSQVNPNRVDCVGPAKKLVNGCCEDGLCPDGSIRIPGGIVCKAEKGFEELDGCCVCPCCGSGDPCCGSVDPCCGNPDPCCGSTDPCCGTSDPCCGSTDPCCGTSDPCCGNPDPCCTNPGDPNCNPDPCMGNPDPCCGNPDPCCGNPDPKCGQGGGGGKKKCEDAGDPGLDCMGPGCCGNSSYCNPETGKWACECRGTINARDGTGSSPDTDCIHANGTTIGYYSYEDCGCKFDDLPCENPQPCYNNGVACGMQTGPNCECPPDCNNNGDNFNN